MFVCVYMCGHACMLTHAYLFAFVCVCVCVCVYQTDSLINLSLCVGPVDLGCHGDGNRVGPGNGL